MLQISSSLEEHLPIMDDILRLFFITENNTKERTNEIND